MKKMKLFFLGICAAFATTASAQVTLTAADATDKAAGWTLSLDAPKAIAGWQMQVALPEGVTIPVKETINFDGAAFTCYDVALPGYGGKYKAVGTPTEGGLFLFFIPVSNTYTTEDFTITDTKCIIQLQADSYEGAAAVKITNIAAADAEGVSISGEEVKNFDVNHPMGDVTGNFTLDVRDMSTVLNAILNEKTGELDKSLADMNGDDEIDVRDMSAQLKVILSE